MVRQISGWFVGLVAFCLLAGVCHADSMKVTLLGTGAAAPYPGRFGPSTLVEAGAEKLIFDMGRGCATRLFQLNIPPDAITAHFFTHLHSDHTVGFPDLWLTGWFGRPWPLRIHPLVVFGPPGTEAMTENLTKAFSEDLRIRTADQHLPISGAQFVTKDVGPGLVYDKNGVKVTAILVDHGGEIGPAYGYIIEYDGKKVVLSGDTKYNEGLANAAKGSDLLVHEVAVIEPELLKINPKLHETLERHVTPEEAGRVFSIAKPTLAVYSHIVFYTVKPAQDVSEEVLVQRTKTTYRGDFLVGRDLMSFVIDHGVKAFGADGERLIPFGSGAGSR